MYSSKEIRNLTAVELGRKIADKEITSVQATKAYLEQIENTEKNINAYITVMAEKALERADFIDKKIADGEIWSNLMGVPMAIKDVLCMKDTLTSCGSKILGNFYPTYTSTAVENLLNAGVVVLGKTNMDEFAMGSTTESSYFGATKNPWDLNRVPGGSSGGSAAAVAANSCAAALGTDTGGSIRQPASFCGITGIKPTYGRVSRYGQIAYGSSLDQIGPMAKDITDCAAILEIISGHDCKDSTSADRDDTDFTSSLENNVKGMKIGVPKDYFLDGIDEDVKTNVLAAAEKFRELGAEVEYFDLGMVKYAIPAYYIIACAEASSNLERFDGVKYGYRTPKFTDLNDMYKKTRSEGFGDEVKRRIMLGSFVLSSGYFDAYYVKALRVKALIKQAFDSAFEKYDIILSPVAPTTALKIGESLSDPIKMYLGDVYTVSINLTGIPAVSLPCGYDKDGLPIGLQLMAQTFNEKTAIKATYTFEQSFKENLRHSPMYE